MIARTPVKRKRSKPRRGRVRDPKYLAWLRGLACILAGSSFSSPCGGKTEAAHVGARGLGQKCSDREALPMCANHHRLAGDSHHRAGKLFWAHHGFFDVTEVLADYNARFDLETVA